MYQTEETAAMSAATGVIFVIAIATTLSLIVREQ
jgi:hypothetical protein